MFDAGIAVLFKAKDSKLRLAHQVVSKIPNGREKEREREREREKKRASGRYLKSREAKRLL